MKRARFVMAALTVSALALGSAGGCSRLAGFLHMQPVEVTAHFPCEPFVDPADAGWVSVSFSSPMHRPRTEEAFRLSEAGTPLPGSFDWEEQGRTLRFTPAAPLRAATAYSLAVSTAAEDLYGNSLSTALSFRFVTGTELDPPAVTEHWPEDGATVSDLRAALFVRFSEPMEPGSLLAGLSVVPTVRGSLSASAAGSEIAFQPLEDYAAGELYTVRLSREVRDLSGNCLPDDVEFRFRTFAPAQPAVQAVVCAGSGRALHAQEDGGSIDLSLGVEKDQRFEVTLSLPLGPAERQSAIDLVPAVPLRLSWNPAGDSCQVEFGEHLQWNRLYTLRVLDRHYGFVVNGEGSLPPEVTSISYCPDILEAAPRFVVLAFGANYGFSPAPAPVFDFHLSHAQGAAIDLGSFLRALSVEASAGCLSLQCLAVAVSPLAVDPDPLPGPGQSVVRLFCRIDDDEARSGLLSFRLDTQLGDSLGNLLQADHVLVVNNNPD